jgi:hypothetical protein
MSSNIELAKSIMSLISRYNIKSVTQGRILYSAIYDKEFNVLFYNSNAMTGVISIKRIYQDFNVPILLTPDDRLVNAFKLKYTKRTPAVNETNNNVIQFIASSFNLCTEQPPEFKEVNYKEECMIRILIVRETNRLNEKLGPKVSDILQVSNNPNEYNIITANINVDSKSNYQVLLSLVIQMSIDNPCCIVSKNIKYINNPELRFSNGVIDQTANPLEGNFYIGAIKKTSSSSINPTTELNETELHSITNKILALDPQSSYPTIPCISRHLFQ